MKLVNALSKEDFPIELSPMTALIPGDRGTDTSAPFNVSSIELRALGDPLKKLETVLMRDISVTAITNPLKVGRHFR